MVDDSINHANIFFRNVVSAVVRVRGRAEIFYQVVGDGLSISLNVKAKLVHLIDAFFASEFWALTLGGGDGEDKEDSEDLHLELAEQNSPCTLR
eukprot:TRINITY_DN139_c2_g1_i12.p1 TRINITY_DN139_c2_g1~~TRINITY_DN139_c2_g1_i12.p1  ORF type:complete len:108 (-),score=25.73 TRINITY_DN139_c2_g1_i12:2-283(-)